MHLLEDFPWQGFLDSDWSINENYIFLQYDVEIALTHWYKSALPPADLMPSISAAASRLMWPYMEY